MSLLRRRTMMQEPEQDENVIYLYSGYLPSSGTVETESFYHPAFPNAMNSSPFFLKSGQSFDVIYDGGNPGTRVYDADGDFKENGSSWINQSYAFDCYIRLACSSKITISSFIIVEADGTEINYKIIDRR